jgi:hypothetical protein
MFIFISFLIYMKKSNKRSNKRSRSLKRKHHKTQKVWKMRGCSVHSCDCKMQHHKCGKNGVCSVCHHRCYTRGRTSKHGGTADAELAYPSANVPTTPNPHFAYTGVQKAGCDTCQMGGSCGTMCPLNQNGGGYVDVPSPLAPINAVAVPQPPFVGAPWGPMVSQWPGVSAPHDGSHLAKNSYDIQPEMNPIDERTTSNRMAGGRRRRIKGKKSMKRRHMKGGDYGIFSQLGTDMRNVYRGWNGEPALPSPLPYKDQMFYGRNAQDNLNYLKVG